METNSHVVFPEVSPEISPNPEREDKKIRLLLERFVDKKLPHHIHDLIKKRLGDIVTFGIPKSPAQSTKLIINTNTNRVNAQIEGKEEGIKEMMKEETKEEEMAKNKLQGLASRNHVTLMKTKTFFPFDFFPDTLIIDMTKINIISKQFFATERVININLKDLVDVSLETAWFMGNLVITYLPMLENSGLIKPLTFEIKLLRRRDAVRAQRILKGILIARREGIEISKCSPEELTNVIERFGECKVKI